MNDSGQNFIDFCRRRFGIAEKHWEDYRFQVNARSVYLLAKSTDIDLDWECEARGFRAGRRTSHSFKPGNRFVQLVGDAIRKNKIELTAEEFKKLLKRENIKTADKAQQRGYVALFFQGFAIGCGFWTGEELRTQMSKSICAEFPREIFET